MVSTREAKTMSMKQLFAEDAEAIVQRVTGKSIKQWEDKMHARLINDVSKGRLNPDAYFPLSRMNKLCNTYGLMDDDLIFVRVPTSVLVEHNPWFTPPKAFFDGGRTEVKTMIAIRLNPEKYDGLSGLYSKVRAL